MRLDFEGIDELIAELNRIEGVTDEIRDRALIRGGDILKEQMKREVYAHGLRRRTGEAEKSITRTDPEHGELFVGTQGGKNALVFICICMNLVFTTYELNDSSRLSHSHLSRMKTRNRRSWMLM